MVFVQWFLELLRRIECCCQMLQDLHEVGGPGKYFIPIPKIETAKGAKPYRAPTSVDIIEHALRCNTEMKPCGSSHQ